MTQSCNLTGAAAPESLVLTVTPVADLPDLSVVTGATFAVTDPRGTKRIWTATILFQSATSLVLQHVFVGNDQDEAGEWRAVARLAVPGPGVRRCTPFYWHVDPE